MKVGIAIPLLVALAASVYAGHHGHGWGQEGYFQYANVPAYGQYEFGYNRGNHDHYTSRYEQGHDWRFRTKVRWGDKKGGYGEHYYDYNHVDKGHKGHGNEGHGWGKGHGHGHQSHGHGHHHGHGHGHGHGWGHQHSSYSENIPQVASVKNSQNKPLV